MSEQGRKLHADSSPAAALMGTNGANIIADTDEHTGPFFGILALEDSVIDSATLDSDLITGSLDGVEISGGTYLPLYGVEALTLTSGSVIAYLI